MKSKYTLWLESFFVLCAAACLGQAAAAPSPLPAQYVAQGGPYAQNEPVSYASVTELNGLLGQLESTSKIAQNDLTRLRIERWKTDSSSKKQALSNVESIQRNLQSALPEMIAKLRSTPGDLPATFKLYRNLDALYDVMGSIVESAGAFGGKDDFQALSNDLNTFENTRKQIAERIESLSSAKEAEITRLRADLKTAQAAIPANPPPKIVVDDTAPAKKPARKKAAPKSGAPANAKPAQTAPSQPQNPPAQQSSKPQ